jgi:hypothetical protein
LFITSLDNLSALYHLPKIDELNWIMEKTSMSPSPSTDLVEHVEPVAHSDVKPTLPNADIDQEHQLTFRDAWKHHKAIIGWSFFWAMCAIGWFALLSGTVVFKANQSKGV